MANYFVLNNKFTPYTYDELIKPYQAYATEYDKQEALINAAQDKEFSLSNFDTNANNIASTMYNKATSDLNAASENLLRNGLTPKNRANTREAVRNYTTTMHTLESANKKVQEELALRRKEGNGTVYQEDVKIDNYLNGKTPNNAHVNLKDKAQEIASRFGAIAKSMSEDVWDKVFLNDKYTGHYDVTTRQGLEQAKMDMILNATDQDWNEYTEGLDPDDKKIVNYYRNIIQKDKESIGYNKYSPQAQAEIDKAYAIGATAGLQTTTHKYQNDASYNPLGWQQFEFNKRMAIEELKAKHPELDFDDDGKVIGVKEGWVKTKSGWISKDGNSYIDETGIVREFNPVAPFVYGVKVGTLNNKNTLKAAEDAFTLTIENSGELNNLTSENLAEIKRKFRLPQETTDEELFDYLHDRGYYIKYDREGKNRRQQIAVLRNIDGAGKALSGRGNQQQSPKPETKEGEEKKDEKTSEEYTPKYTKEQLDTQIEAYDNYPESLKSALSKEYDNLKSAKESGDSKKIDDALEAFSKQLEKVQ